MHVAAHLNPTEVAPMRDEPMVLRDDEGLRLWRMEGETQRLIVSFTGIGADLNLPPPPDWRRLAGVDPRDHLLFVADPARSWLNRAGIIEEIVDAIEAEVDRCGATSVVTLGHSMGGFSALVIPAFTQVDVAVAMSPQLAIDPVVVPSERRWSKQRQAIEKYRVSNAADNFVSPCEYFVFFCRHRREVVQLDLVPKGDNVNLYVLPNSHHNTPKRLKEMGVLDQVLAACFAKEKQTIETLLGTSAKSQVPTDTHLNKSSGSK